MNPTSPDLPSQGHQSPDLRLARWMTGLFIVGLVLSGLTAMPVITQLRAVTSFVSRDGTSLGEWLWRVRDAAEVMGRDMPFMFYGYDWLAFGHLAIALAFVPAWKDPVQHRWLSTYGLVLCGLVVVWAMAVAPFRGVPMGWRLIDCSFGLLGAVPLVVARTASGNVSPVDIAVRPGEAEDTLLQ